MKYLIAGLFAILCGGYFWTWNAAQTTCCAATPAITTPAAVSSHGPLVFNWAKSATVTNALFPAYRDSIVNTLGANDKLEIVGLYNVEEENTSSFENMGLARANETKKLFLDLVPDDRIILKAKDVGQSETETLFASVRFNSLKNTKTIVEIDDKTIIYFPLNSTSKLNSREVEQYLDKVAQRVTASGEKVNIVGHTCDRGEAAHNISLGKRRADLVANYLQSKGVSVNQLSVKSEGEANPITPNTSEENREKNRRTVLQIIK